MAMPLQEKAPGAWSKCQGSTSLVQVLLEGAAALGHHACFLPQLPLQQGRVVILDGQNAAWLAGEDGMPFSGPGIESLDIMLRIGHSLPQHTIGDEGPA